MTALWSVRAGLLITSVVLIAAACDDAAIESTNPPGDPVESTHIFDGDSFEVDLGGSIDQVRMLGINAPERNECLGNEARGALAAILEGQDVFLVTDPLADGRDRFGRVLAYVYVNGENVNEAMLSEGHAIVVQSDHDRNAAFIEIASEAAAKEIGMWAPNACAPAEPEDIQILLVEWDPAGPDDDALNDEYVEIKHEGSSRVDLTGWVLRDESSSNRYHFSGSLEAGDRLFVRSGCGDDRGEDRYWCAEHSIWSNGGDTAMLQDAKGNVVSWWTYDGR